MINTKYKLTSPLSIETFCENVDYNDRNIIIKPEKLSICKADMRYYFGMRDAKILKKRLPLALIHEACGIVLHDGNGKFQTGQKVVLLPNIPGKEEGVGENYRRDSLFRSSRADGFMQEIVSLPESQVVPYDEMTDNCAAITEFISVGVHAVRHYLAVRRRPAKTIGVWGDGGLGYIVCCMLKHYLPDVKVTIVGVNRAKLSTFQFVDERLTIDEITEKNHFDDVFECVGGSASGNAIDQMIDTITPEGMITLLGVSEEPVPINTRMVLEKGLTLIGRSRSAREDFVEAVHIMETSKKVAKRMSLLISEIVEIHNINDIHKAFNESKIVDFKLVMDWMM